MPRKLRDQTFKNFTGLLPKIGHRTRVATRILISPTKTVHIYQAKYYYTLHPNVDGRWRQEKGATKALPWDFQFPDVEGKNSVRVYRNYISPSEITIIVNTKKNIVVIRKFKKQIV